MKDLSIIIVNYNVKEFILNLVNSIRKAAKNISSEIFIVDNASDDGSVELISENFPEVNLIQNKKNVGFGVANNQAMKLATGKYFLIINPDTIVREDTLSKMIRFMDENPQVGISGCKVLNPDGSLQLACRRSFPGPWTSFTKVMGLSNLFPKSKLFARYNLTYLDENQTYEVDAVSGSFMMMRKDVYDKIGGFDPQFFMYGEDLDLCFRTQKAGYKVYYYHETEIIHYKGESTKRSKLDETTVFYNAMHLFVKKHLASSFLVEGILQAAIILRKLIAFANVFKLSLVSFVMDFLFFSAAIIIAEKIYLDTHSSGFPNYVVPWIYFVPSLFQTGVSALTGAYKKNSLLVLKTIFSLFYGMLFLSTITYFFKQYGFSRAVVIITYVISFVSFLSWRIILKAFFKIGLDINAKKARTLIVGNQEVAEEIALKLKTNSTRLHQIVGMISLSRKKIGEKFGAYKVIGSIDNIKKIIDEGKIEKVILSSEDLSFDDIFKIVADCQGLNAEFLVAGKGMDYLVGKSAVTMLDDISLLKVDYNISSFVHSSTKRIFDFIVSIFSLIFIYPFIYLFEKFTSKSGDFTKFILSIPKVCLGEKSFVGPRSSSFNDGLYVGKVGLTGFWFIDDVKEEDIDEIKKLDIFYAKNQNIWLDLEILGKTFSKMFFRTE